MAQLFITISLVEINKHKLNLNEYLTLVKYQHVLEGKSFPFEPDTRFIVRLMKDGFVTKNSDGFGFTLGPAGIKIFQGDDLFEEFYATFPHKVPTGTGFRPVSTNDPNGMSAKVTRSIWNRITKNKPYLQQTIIDSLKRELEQKKSTNSLGYLNNIDTWLRQATWEKWEDIPDEKKSNNFTKL